ncbi:MAG: LCCL domain-containing protein [Trueperaceae bacterium]|nr:LCCL domain-containing protein [Trueperaceae bacterium]
MLGVPRWFALLIACMAVTAVHAQTTFDMSLNTTRAGTIPTEQIDHVYVLNLPAGGPDVHIRVDAGGDDADLAIYAGFEERELFYDISTDPNPSFTLRAPQAGRYEIYVKNLLWQPLAYELHVYGAEAGDVAPNDGPRAASPSVSVGARAVAPAAPITARFGGTPGFAKDWVGLYRSGASDREHLDWQYTEGRATGELVFDAPREPGRYEFRLFENDGYTRLAASGAFEVRAAPSPSAPGGAVTLLTCDQRANAAPLDAQQEGTSLRVTCPSGCPTTGRLWGTDVYTHDSHVCLAARHAGVIGPEGGTFTLTMLPGQDGYVASTRNGVASVRWGSWPASFAVSRQPTTDPAPTKVETPTDLALAGTWQVNANGYTGTLTFRSSDEGWVGTLDLGRADALEEIEFDGFLLRFVRPLSALDQVYEGRLVEEDARLRLSGRFYQRGTASEYHWWAERTR